jgi:hypothetical protein
MLHVCLLCVQQLFTTKKSKGKIKTAMTTKKREQVRGTKWSEVRQGLSLPSGEQRTISKKPLLNYERRNQHL